VKKKELLKRKGSKLGINKRVKEQDGSFQKDLVNIVEQKLI
jgi:hypothetical protein